MCVRIAFASFGLLLHYVCVVCVVLVDFDGRQAFLRTVRCVRVVMLVLVRHSFPLWVVGCSPLSFSFLGLLAIVVVGVVCSI